MPILLGCIVKDTAGSHDDDEGNSSKSLKGATPSRELRVGRWWWWWWLGLVE